MGIVSNSDVWFCSRFHSYSLGGTCGGCHRIHRLNRGEVLRNLWMEPHECHHKSRSIRCVSYQRPIPFIDQQHQPHWSVLNKIVSIGN